MKYIKKFNTELSYNNFLESDNYKRPNVSKIGNKIYYNKRIKRDFMTLIHYWDSDDVGNSGAWIDRINGHSLNRFGNPTVNSNGLLEVSVNNSFGRSYGVGIYLGDEWEIETKFMIPKQPNNTSYIFDFGSLYNSQHAFGLNISSSSKISTNSKLNGNSSPSLYNVIVPFDSYGKLTTIVVGMERYNDQYNRHYVRYNNNTYYAQNLVLREYATFNANFDKDQFYIGRGTNGDTEYQSDETKYIKYVKIYKNEAS